MSIFTASKKHLTRQKIIRFFKILDKKTKDNLSIALNQNNRIVDYNKHLKRKTELTFEKFGNLHPALYCLIKKGGDRIIPAIIFLSIKEKHLDKVKLSSITEARTFKFEVMEIKQQVEKKQSKLWLLYSSLQVKNHHSR